MLFEKEQSVILIVLPISGALVASITPPECFVIQFPSKVDLEIDTDRLSSRKIVFFLAKGSTWRMLLTIVVSEIERLLLVE